MKYSTSINEIVEELYKQKSDSWANFYHKIYKEELSVKFDSTYHRHAAFAIPIKTLCPYPRVNLINILDVLREEVL